MRYLFKLILKVVHNCSVGVASGRTTRPTSHPQRGHRSLRFNDHDGPFVPGTQLRVSGWRTILDVNCGLPRGRTLEVGDLQVLTEVRWIQRTYSTAAEVY